MSDTAIPAQAPQFAVDRAAFVQRDRQRRQGAHEACQNVVPLIEAMRHRIKHVRMAADSDLIGMTRSHLEELRNQVADALKALPEV